MKSSTKNLILSSALVLLAGLVLVGSIWSGKADISRAQGVGAWVVGYAWSDTIGWISLSCLNEDTCNESEHSVAIAANGRLSGYAWSDSIGWISFNTSDLSGCPAGACNARIAGDDLQGWARALSPTQEIGDENHENGGWDGWINLEGVGISLLTGAFSGYAWGSDVVGWVDFGQAQAVSTAAPQVVLAADPAEVNSGDSTRLNWETQNAISCEASDGWSGEKPTAEDDNESEVISNLTTTTDFTLTCQNITGVEASDTVTVLVRDPDFSLSIDPGTLEMLSGDPESPTATLEAFGFGGFEGNIDLSAEFTSSAPSGVTIVMPSVIESSDSVPVFIDTPSGIAAGIHTILITGTATINEEEVVRNVGLTIYVEREPVQYEDF